MALPKFARCFSYLCHSVALPRFARGYSTYKFHITEEMMNTMPIQMWWDLDSYVPESQRLGRVMLGLINQCRWMRLKGPVSMVAYGNSDSLSAETRKEFADAMTLNHVPSGAVLEVMSRDMIKWGEENPPPACCFLISGNRQFLHTLNKLKPLGYTTVAALPAR